MNINVNDSLKKYHYGLENTISSICRFLDDLTSSINLLLLNAAPYAFILFIHIYTAADSTEHQQSILGISFLQEPSRTLREEEEPQELQRSRNNWQTQHIPIRHQHKNDSNIITKNRFLWNTCISHSLRFLQNVWIWLFVLNCFICDPGAQNQAWLYL